MGKKCNMCGKPYKLAETNIHSFKVNFEYGSPHDGETWKFSICDDCIACLTECFEIQHDVTERIELV